jgi:hypothetical protein
MEIQSAQSIKMKGIMGMSRLTNPYLIFEGFRLNLALVIHINMVEGLQCEPVS